MADDLQQFMSITGANQAIAEHLLEACDGNVQLAIEMHLDGGFTQADSAVNRQVEETETDSTIGPTRQVLPDIVQNAPGISSDVEASADSSNFSEAQSSMACETDVRAPIPQTRGVLVEDPYHAVPYPRSRARQPGRSVFDGFRDFEAETRRQEELLNNATVTSTATSSKSESKIRTLQELFRPPVDITFKGTFEAAKEAGMAQNKWLLINIQNVSEFACQTLNRDVWSNPLVRDLITEHFILWQVYHDSDEGQRFMVYYPVKNFPNISIIDPRTGECLVVWNKFENMDSQLFCDLVTQFLSTHPDFVADTEFPPEKKQKKDCVIDETEDQQLAAAIAASLDNENPHVKTHQSVDNEFQCEDDDVESFDYSDDEVTSSNAKSRKTNDRLGINNAINQCASKFEANRLERSPPLLESQQATSSSTSRCAAVVVEEGEDESKINGPFTKLMLRLPEGNRKQIKMAADAQLKDLAEYIASIGYSRKKFELVTNFPRRNVSEMDDSKTLQEAGLSPQETIFVQQQ
eukprot:gene11200-12375_t